MSVADEARFKVQFLHFNYVLMPFIIILMSQALRRTKEQELLSKADVICCTCIAGILNIVVAVILVYVAIFVH